MKTKITMGFIGFALLIAAAFLWDNYNDLYIVSGFAGILLIGGAATTEGKQVKD